MARIISEQKNINDNLFEYESRLQSPYNRYIDKYPTYVTYYHISNDETTVDEGWKDSEGILDENSSLRFNKIDDFPLYGISQIVLSINDDDQGLDSSYEGEAVFLPHTIKPYQNDFFVVNHLKRHDVYIFRITSIEFDNIHPDNFYKANFILEATDPALLDQLEKQVTNKFSCINENIGTDKVCIMETDRYIRIKEVMEMYQNIAKTYMSIFYNEKYNCFLGEKPCNKKLYDPYMIEFVNKWGLFNEKNRINTFILSQEIQDNRFAIKYEKSIWRFIERNDMTLINPFYYFEYHGRNLPYSSFALWHDDTIEVLDISLGGNTFEQSYSILNESFIENVKDPEAAPPSDFAAVLKHYIRKDKMDIYSFPLNLHESLLSLNANLEFFFVTPIILYIIQRVVEDEMKDNTLDVSNSITL